MARDKKTGQAITIGHGGMIFSEKKPKVTYPTGWGDEVYYHDEDGFICHIPPRTEFSHPYSFDPIVLFYTGKEHQRADYSDRLQQWDYDKFKKCMEEAGNVSGELHFRWGNRDQVTKLMRLYYDDPKLEVVKVVKQCNANSGYPLWIIYYNPGAKEKSTQA